MSKPKFAVIECETGSDAECYYVTFTADGKSVLGLSTSGFVRWDAETGKLLKIEKQPGMLHARGLAISPNFQKLAVQSLSEVSVLLPSSLQEVTRIKQRAEHLAWSRDGKRLVGGSGNVVHVWDAANGRELAVLTLKEAVECDDIKFSGFTGGGDEVVIGRRSGLVTWNLQKGTHKQRVALKSTGVIFWQHGLSPDGAVMHSLSDKGILIQTETRTWATREFKAIKHQYGRNILFSPDTKLAATGSGHSTLFIWDVLAGATWLKWNKPHFGNLGGFAFSPDGTKLVCTLDFQAFILDFREGARAVTLPTSQIAKGLLQAVMMVGSDNRMDSRHGFDPFNPLPVKCSTCRMPDLDFVPQPYLLGNGVTSPAELAPAEDANFLVRESAKGVLETVAPGQCKFYPTVHKKTKEPTPWFLAVPQHRETIATPPPERERCPKCGEPWFFHDYSEANDRDELYRPSVAVDVCKTRHWGSPKIPFKDWGEKRSKFWRHLYFSVRLETLFKKLKVRGLGRSYECKNLPSAEDLKWVEEMMKRLTVKAPPNAPAENATQWFNDYVRKHAKKQRAAPDFTTIEARGKLTLPQTYKTFISTVGPKKFKDVDGEEGFTAKILPPQKFDLDEFRKTESTEEEEAIDGIVFAETEHGDVFCFDVAASTADYPVYKYDHETDEFEPYAGNFAECIKRFAGAP